MALLDILEAPDRRLTTVCAAVERIDGGLLHLLDDMLEESGPADDVAVLALHWTRLPSPVDALPVVDA